MPKLSASLVAVEMVRCCLSSEPMESSALGPSSTELSFTLECTSCVTTLIILQTEDSSAELDQVGSGDRRIAAQGAAEELLAHIPGRAPVRPKGRWATLEED